MVKRFITSQDLELMYIDPSLSNEDIADETGFPLEVIGPNRALTLRLSEDKSLQLTERETAIKNSHIDDLTTLWRRNYFFERIKAEMEFALESDRSPVVGFIDIDNFKRINDMYSHMAGDKVLKEVALRIKTGVNPDRGLVARLGGEEFGVLLQREDLKNALSIFEQIREGVYSLVCDVNDVRISTSISYGVAPWCPEYGADVKRIVHAADTALLTAKKNGKNRGYIFDCDSNILSVDSRLHK